MEYSNLLQNIGLSEKEAKIYLTLIKLGQSLPSTISKISGVKRPTTYIVLDELKKRGLVSHFIKGKTTFFRAVDPRALVEEQKNKLLALEKTLPDILKLNTLFAATPQISLFEGKEGLIRIMNDTLTAKTELLCWADVTLAVTSLNDYYPNYVKKKVERKIWLRGVFSYDPLAVRFKKHSDDELREVHLIPKEKFPFKNEINIYDDKVAIISHEDSIGVIIQNKNIADTQRSIFNLGFEYAKIVEKEMNF